MKKTNMSYLVAVVPLVFFSLALAPTLVSAVSFVTTPGGVTVVATVDIYNAKIVEQEGNIFKLSFDLSNGANVQPEVKYGVVLMKVSGQDQIKVDEKIYPEVVNLGENQTLPKEITYEAPEYLNGTFQLWLNAQNASGMLLAINPLGDVTLTGDGKFLEINTASCYLSVNGEVGNEKYTLRQGVDIKSDEKLTVSCEVVNHYDREITVIPDFKTYWRSTSGKLVADNQELQSAVSLKAQEKKVLSFILPKAAEPQAYDAVLVLLENGTAVSNPVVSHYVLRGASATIQSVKLDKDYYAKGSTATLSLFWTPSADSFPDSRFGATAGSALTAEVSIKDAEGRACSENISKALDGKTIEAVLDIPIIADCMSPQISAVIKDASGVTLDQKLYAVDSTSQAWQQNAFQKYGMYALTIISMLIAMGLLALYLYLKRKKVTIMPILFFFLIGFGFFFPVSVANAVEKSFEYGSVFTVSLNKDIYSSEETMVVTASEYSDIDCINASLRYWRIFVEINGVTEEFSGRGGGYTTLNFVAPSAPGDYEAKVFQANGTTLLGTIPYKVVEPRRTLTVTKAGTGSGTVTSSSGTWSWNSLNGIVGTATFARRTSVTLTATPNSDSSFSGWSGACSGSTCTVTMDSDKYVTATFTPKTLNVSCSATQLQSEQYKLWWSWSLYTRFRSTITAGVTGTATGPVTYTFNCSNGTTQTFTSTPNPATANDTKSYDCLYSNAVNPATVKVDVTRDGITAPTCTFDLSNKLRVTLTANPSTVVAGQSTTITANVTGTANGPINYNFNCADNPYGMSTNYQYTTNSTQISRSCRYYSMGSYSPNVIVTRGGFTSQLAYASVSVTPLAPVNGACSSPQIHYTCIPSTTVSTKNNGSSPTEYTWECPGTNGGLPATCLQPKTCPNGANNPSACNRCTSPLVWSSSSASCVACNGGCTGGVCNSGAINPPVCNKFKPIVTLFYPTKTSIDVGQGTSLNWVSMYAASCTGTEFTASVPSGSRSIGPLTPAGIFQYHIYCVGAGGRSDTRSTSVEVFDPGIEFITATPNRVRSGEQSTIAWSARGVNSCAVARNNNPTWNSDLISTGTLSNPITSQTVFKITCQTNGLPVTKSVTVNVVPDFQEF